MNGRVDFQREMTSQHQVIRDCFNFTGPLDPLKGDAVYVAIQATARETVDNLFNDALRNRNDTVRPVDSFAGAGVGNAAATAPVKGMGGGSRAPAAPKDDWLNRAKGTFSGVPQPAAPAQPAGPFQAPAAPAQPQMTGRYGAPAAAAPAQPAAPAPAQPAAPIQPAVRGGLFSRNKAPAPAPAPAAPVYTPPVVKAGSAVTDGSYERKLVEELCTPQGMRPEPPKDKLTRFATACQTLDAAVVGPLLLAKLGDKNWKVVMKALYTIQEILHTPNTDGFTAYFTQNTEELQMLGNYPHPMVKKLAGTVFDALTGAQNGEQGAEPSAFVDAAPAQVMESAPSGDFDFFSAAAPAPAAPAAAPAPRAAAPAPAASNDPFAFNATGDIDSAFAFAQPAAAPAAAPRAAPAPANDDPFGMNFAGGSDLNSAFQGLAPAAPARAAAPAPAARAAPAASSFLDMYSAPAPAAPAAAPAPAPAAGGFDFFGAPAAPAPAAPAAPAQPAMNFGMPAQQPMQPMQQQPAMNYGMPAQQPAMNYGMPAQQQPAQQQPAAMNFDFFGM